jgi:hypothetical protein
MVVVRAWKMIFLGEYQEADYSIANHRTREDTKKQDLVKSKMFEDIQVQLSI